MDYKEGLPLPKQCQDCQVPDCYNCDFALSRWPTDLIEELKMQKKNERAGNSTIDAADSGNR